MSVLLFAGCASAPPGQHDRARREQMVERARHEIDRRGLPLPKQCEIKVEEGFSQPENRPRTRIFGVLFRFPYRGVKDTVYIVWFDEHGAVYDVTDYRTVVPLFGATAGTAIDVGGLTRRCS